MKIKESIRDELASTLADNLNKRFKKHQAAYFLSGESGAPTEVKDFVSTFSQREARFVKVNAKNIGICPEWHSGSGNRGWLFVDEIVIN